METTIRISEDVKRQLDRLKMFKRESYNELIQLLLEDHLEINDKTKKELAEARIRIKKGEFHTQDEVEKRLGI